MVQILKDGYFSKADAFILPLTGLPNNNRFNIRSYLFWDDYSIEDFNLILTFAYEHKMEFVDYCRRVLFPTLDKNATSVLESYDIDDNSSVMILNMSEWAMDIQMFLNGKYSKLSKPAKEKIELYHTYFVDRETTRIPLWLYSILYPSKQIPANKGDVIGKMTPIEYVSKEYNLDLTEMQKVGELGSFYQIKEETLTINQKKPEGLQEV